MADKLVSRKTGKLAKKVGFNWKCTDYVDIEVRTGNLSKDYEPDGFTNSFIGKDSKGFTLPTQTKLHKFLMDMGYYIQIKKHFTCYAYQVLKYNEYEDGNELVVDEEHADFVSYELALEDGLFQTLELIKV